jgi:hypothetical protein
MRRAFASQSAVNLLMPQAAARHQRFGAAIISFVRGLSHSPHHEKLPFAGTRCRHASINPISAAGRDGGLKTIPVNDRPTLARRLSHAEPSEKWKCFSRMIASGWPDLCHKIFPVDLN